MISEKELITEVLNGNAQAFQTLVRQYERLVLHVVCRVLNQDEDIADICQEAFIKVYKGLAKFNYQSKLSTWIARIAYLTAITYLQKEKKYDARKELATMDELDIHYFSEETPEHKLIRKDESAYVHALITRLPIVYRTLLTLHYLEEFSYGEIQEITGMPEGTVKSYLARGRGLLKTMLKKYLKNESHG